MDEDVDGAIAAVKELAQAADDVIRGTTTVSNYFGEVNSASPASP
jgi:hypothetical protein